MSRKKLRVIESIHASHRHLGHRLWVGDAESFERLEEEEFGRLHEEESEEGTDDEDREIFFYCWCNDCNAAVTLRLRIMDEDLCMEVKEEVGTTKTEKKPTPIKIPIQRKKPTTWPKLEVPRMPSPYCGLSKQQTQWFDQELREIQRMMKGLNLRRRQ